MEEINQVIQRKHLSTSAMCKFLLETSEEIENLVLCKPNTIDLVTSDQELYEALGYANQEGKLHPARLVKLIESVSIQPVQRIILTDEKLTQIKTELNN
jgi:hypothetical protein